MKASQKHQLKQTIGEVNPVRFELVYRILLKRLAAGYTRAELSFFLGFGPTYWERIENFSRCGDLTVADLLCLADVFACPVTDFCRDAPAGINSEPMHIQLSERTDEYRIQYEAYQLTGNAEPVLLYKLWEEQPGIYDRTYAETGEKAIDIITSLFESGFFNTPKDTVEIFKECARRNGEAIKPRFIEKALKTCLLPKKPHGLKRQGGSRYDVLAKAYQFAQENENK